FHHDAASKLQSLVMALDEMTELGESTGDPDVARIATTSFGALRELQTLFNANRALTRPPQPVRISPGELIGRAAERAALVVHGEIPAVHVEANVPALTHAVAVVFDLASGPIKLGRAVAITASHAAGQVALTVRAPAATTPPPAHVSEMIAIATFAIRRDRGDLRSARNDGFVIRLPTS